jgi:hypothetical protein
MTDDEKIIVLRSPFNGGELRLPPETPPDLIQALLDRDFRRIDPPKPPPKISRARADDR